MTTIAYRDGVLAGDTRETCGDIVLPTNERKVFKLRNGRLFGAAGTSEHCELMKQAASINGALQLPAFEGAPEVSAITVDPDGTAWYSEGGVWVKNTGPYISIGSGSTCAQVAMWMGADAKKAVKAGIVHDKNSGGRVVAVSLKNRRKRDAGRNDVQGGAA